MYSSIHRMKRLQACRSILQSYNSLKTDLQMDLCRRYQSTLIQNIDNALTLSTANPLFTSTVSLFDVVHSSTGLPWWAAIVATTFCVRAVVQFPIMVAGQRNMAKLKNLQPELAVEMQKTAYMTRQAKWAYRLSPSETRKTFRDSSKKARLKFYEKHNVHPMKGIVTTFSSLPIWVTISLTLRTMSGQFDHPPHSGFIEGGGFWFTDLCATDPTLILPVIFGASTLANIRLAQKLSPASSTFDVNSRGMERTLRIVAVPLAGFMTLLAVMQPTAPVTYWLSSSVFGLLQYLLLAVPAVRRALGIQYTDNEPNIKRLLEKR